MPKIHPLALVDPKAKLAEDVEIGPFCTVGPDVTLGKGTRLISHVSIDGWTEVGERNVFFPFGMIGAVPQDLKYKGERTKLEIGNDNVIRESVSLHLGTQQGGGVTKIGHHNLIMALVHIGHDCIIGNHCIIATSTGIAGHAILEDHVILGGMTGVGQFIRIGAHSYIGGQSGVEKDIPPFVIAVGSRPIAVKGVNIVGLRRRGFASDTISKILESIKLWTRADVEKERCLLEIESQYGDVEEVQQLLSFIKKSENGVTR